LQHGRDGGVGEWGEGGLAQDGGANCQLAARDDSLARWGRQPGSGTRLLPAEG